MSLFIILAIAVGADAQWWTYQDPALTDAGVSINVNTEVKYQMMIGGGCSGAFGIACQQFGSVGLSPKRSDEVTQILFDENIGGLSVLRNDIGSTPGNVAGDVGTILPKCPKTPDGPFHYVSFGNDSCQVSTADPMSRKWMANIAQLNLTQTALKYNPDLFIYADAWSAPGCCLCI